MVRKVFAIASRLNSKGQHVCGLHIKGNPKGKSKGKHKGKGPMESDGSDGPKGKGKGDSRKGKGDDQGKGEGKGEYQVLLSCLINDTLIDDPEIRGSASMGSTQLSMTADRFYMVATAMLTPGTECIALEMEECDEDPADA